MYLCVTSQVFLGSVSDLGNFKTERVAEVFGLSDDQQVETPASRKVCDDYRPDRSREKELFPRSDEPLQQQEGKE